MNKPKTEYVPPDEQVFEQLAKRFCETVSERGDSFSSSEVVQGLAEFLTVVARLTAKSLTDKQPSSPEDKKHCKKNT